MHFNCKVLSTRKLFIPLDHTYVCTYGHFGLFFVEMKNVKMKNKLSRYLSLHFSYLTVRASSYIHLHTYVCTYTSERRMKYSSFREIVSISDNSAPGNFPYYIIILSFFNFYSSRLRRVFPVSVLICLYWPSRSSVRFTDLLIFEPSIHRKHIYSRIRISRGILSGKTDDKYFPGFFLRFFTQVKVLILINTTIVLRKGPKNCFLTVFYCYRCRFRVVQLCIVEFDILRTARLFNLFTCE